MIIRNTNKTFMKKLIYPENDSLVGKINSNSSELSKINNRLTEENFLLFDSLVLNEIPKCSITSEEDKYSVITLKLIQKEMPNIEICIENLSRYTKHAYMCLKPMMNHCNIHYRPYTFRIKIYTDAKLIEVYDLADIGTNKKTINTLISKKILNKPSINQKIILSTMFNKWLKKLITLDYKLS